MLYRCEELRVRQTESAMRIKQGKAYNYKLNAKNKNVWSKLFDLLDLKENYF